MYTARNFPAGIENLPDVMGFLDSVLEEADIDGAPAFNLQLAVDEAFTNIASYAYEDEVGNVQIRISVNGEAVVVSLIDSGKPFDPLKIEPPDITLGIDERKVGGLGIYLIRKMTDSVTYERKDGQNILTMTKNREESI